MMTRRVRSTAALLVASCLVAGPALAEPREAKDKETKTVSDKDKQIASDLVKKAIARSQAGDHSAAIDIYLQAYTIVPNSILLSNIGSEFQQQGKQKEALRYFCMYLEKDPSGTNVPYATTQAKQLQAMLGNKVEDDDVCAPPKRHRTTTPSDPGEDDDTTPTTKPRTAPGGSTADAPAHDVNETMRYGGIAVGAAGVIGVAVGIWGGVKAQHVSDEISSHPKGEAWVGIDDAQSRGKTYEYVQIGGLIGGGALVGVGIYLYLHAATAGKAHDADKPKPDPDERTVHLTPTSNGVAVFGRF